jgi:hypothetical protein
MIANYRRTMSADCGDFAAYERDSENDRDGFSFAFKDSLGGLDEQART